MRFRLTTVRAKLTALVALSAIVMLAALPVLSWIMERQVVAQVNDRVPDAVHGFELELSDDLRNLATIVDQLASQAEVRDALVHHDAAAIVKLGAIFHAAYPHIDFVFFDATGQHFAETEVDHPWSSTASVPELAALVPDVAFRGVTAKGCESEAGAVPAFVAAKRLDQIGTVLACLPLDADYLNEVQQKIGVELAFFAPATAPHATAGTALLGTTKKFPAAGAATATLAPTLIDVDGHDWALARVTPPSMQGREGVYGAIIALDFTDVRDIVRHNRLLALLVLGVATVVSVALGARLAGVMSRAISSVNHAVKRLAQHEYVKVEAVRTGDELEDLAAAFNTMVDGLKERDKLRTTFGKYMTQTVMEHLMSGKVQLGGETLTVTILFSDIRSFTSISEQMNDAQALVGLLNEYFTAMVTIVMEEDGVVDKYIGDAIMAVFGAPVSKPDDAVRAARAAVRMRVALADLNTRLIARGVTPLRTGIGIHTGVVVAGNIGSEARMEYTVIGDAVNLASRLESSTKELGVDVLISSETNELVKHACITTPLREITVKGRGVPVMTYELRGLLEPGDQ
jgi:adenylate cyclase